MNSNPLPPIISHDLAEPTIFNPGKLIELSRLQKGLPPCPVPSGCLLDFDGEILEYLASSRQAEFDPNWPCFHTRLYRWKSGENEFGIIGGTIGAPFAVLVAEELFASGCQSLVTLGSAGLIGEGIDPPFFILIEGALRDEGTSYHYLPPSSFVEADRNILKRVNSRLTEAGIPVHRGTTWTTDAPFRETASRASQCRLQGVMAVEMEAAALLALAEARKRKIVCLSHVTNQMAQGQNDFDKGGRSGLETAIRLCEETLRALLSS